MAQRNSITPPAIPAEGKHIESDYRNQDHAMYYDARYLGSRPTRQQAEADLDTYVYELLLDEAIATADMEAEVGI